MTVQQRTVDLPAQRHDHRWHAATYDALIGPGEQRLFSKVRPRLVGDLQGRVLEIGAGTGLNFPHYPSGVSVIAIEPNPHMLKRARRRAESLGLRNIELREASVEKLPFADAEFDHVVEGLVFCTVRDVQRGFAEIRRVLKPGGTFRFLEHVRNDASRFWGTTQDLIAPAWRWFGAGCNPNRRTEQSIEAAGLRFEWIERGSTGFGMPAIYGVARPAEREGA